MDPVESLVRSDQGAEQLKKGTISCFICLFKEVGWKEGTLIELVKSTALEIFQCCSSLTRQCSSRKDVKLSDDEDVDDVKPSTSKQSSSWVHRNLQKIHKVHASKASRYEPNERNPLFAGAELSNLWELSTLSEHFHPSAALFGKTLLDGEQVST